MSRIKKRAVIVAVILVTALALMFFFERNRELSESLKALSYPYDILSGAASSISRNISELFDTAEENRRLKEELLAAETEKQSYSEILAENRRLADLLNLKQRIDSGGMAAHVVGRGYDRISNTLIMDKGSNQGIVKDMPVITAKGLAGKVLSVRMNFSDIILINDLNFSVAVRFKESRREGIVTGSGRNNCILKYVPVEETVKPGDIVITSGLDGIFQAGIPVGQVTTVQTEGVEFFQYIEVEPFQNPSKIEDAIIISRTTTFRETHESGPVAETPAPASPDGE
jgi:rod shape-determining protein MreC